MKKRLLSFILSAALFCGGTIPAMAANGISVTLNGEELTFDVPPVNIDGRVMVPMRGIFEAFGAEVEWYEEDQSIYASDDYVFVSMQIGDPLIYVDFEEVTLDVAPQLVNDRTMVPVRAVSEAFDAEVTWDAATQTVAIKEKEPIDPSQVVLSETHHLLDNRISIDTPEGFDRDHFLISESGAAAPQYNTERLEPQKSNMPLRVLVRELFVLSSGDVEQDAKMYVGEVLEGTDFEYVMTNISDDDTQIMKFTSTSYPEDMPFVELNSALVKATDNLLISVGISLEDGDESERESWLAISDAMIESITIGIGEDTRTFDRTARTINIGRYTLDLPENYIFASQAIFEASEVLGAEELYYIHRALTFEDTIRPLLAMEITDHPSFAYKLSQVQGFTRITDTIDGQSILWLTYEEGGVFKAESIFPVSGSSHLSVKILLSATTEAERQELIDIARTLTLAK